MKSEKISEYLVYLNFAVFRINWNRIANSNQDPEWYPDGPEFAGLTSEHWTVTKADAQAVNRNVQKNKQNHYQWNDICQHFLFCCNYYNRIDPKLDLILYFIQVGFKSKQKMYASLTKHTNKAYFREVVGGWRQKWHALSTINICCSESIFSVSA